MKETALMAASLAAVLSLGCYTQPLEERAFNQHPAVEIEMPGAASAPAVDGSPAATDGDEDEKFDAC